MICDQLVKTSKLGIFIGETFRLELCISWSWIIDVKREGLRCGEGGGGGWVRCGDTAFRPGGAGRGEDTDISHGAVSRAWGSGLVWLHRSMLGWSVLVRGEHTSRVMTSTLLHVNISYFPPGTICAALKTKAIRSACGHKTECWANLDMTVALEGNSADVLSQQDSSSGEHGQRNSCWDVSIRTVMVDLPTDPK